MKLFRRNVGMATPSDGSAHLAIFNKDGTGAKAVGNCQHCGEKATISFATPRDGWGEIEAVAFMFGHGETVSLRRYDR